MQRSERKQYELDCRVFEKERAERMRAWAKDRGLRRKMIGHSGCVHWVALSRGSCPVRPRSSPFWGAECRRQAWEDHVTCWVDQDGKRVMLCQPYGTWEQYVDAVMRTANEWGLEVKIGDGWWHSGTVAIELRRVAP